MTPALQNLGTDDLRSYEKYEASTRRGDAPHLAQAYIGQRHASA